MLFGWQVSKQENQEKIADQICFGCSIFFEGKYIFNLAFKAFTMLVKNEDGKVNIFSSPLLVL